MTPVKRSLLPAFFVLLWPWVVGAQEGNPPPTSQPGQSLRVSLITVGQGDLVWERFGHNFLLFQNVDTGEEVAYHWGVFNFQQVDFVPRLIRGTMLYGMGRTNLDTILMEYQSVGRPVWVQELALTPSQRWELLARTEENYLPANREYRYDYYRDNCSTRVRDALDRVLAGGLKAQFSNDTTAHSYRWHTRRVLQEMPLYYFGIQFVLGPNADRPITVWDEMFLPPALMDRVREVRVPSGVGGDRPLVVEERMLLDTGRPDPPVSPPFAMPFLLALGLLWGGGLILVSRPKSGLPSRLGVVGFAGIWTLVAALGGSLLLGAWVFTDHFFWYQNFNLLQVNPLFLPLTVAFLFFLFRGRFPGWGRKLAAGLGGMALLGAFLYLVPGFGQKNGEILALTLPVDLALWVSAVRLYGSGELDASGPGRTIE